VAFPRGAQLTAPVRMIDITDGSSNTLLLLEAGTPVPWTKPEDISYDPNKPLPKLGGAFPGVINAAFADGSVHTLRRDFDEDVLRAAVTRDGREDQNREELFEPVARLHLREAAAVGRDSTGLEPGDADLLARESFRLRGLLDSERAQIAQLLPEVEDLREQAARRNAPKPDPQRLLQRYAALAGAAERQQAELENLRKEAAALRESLRK
jgi:prepilin-type processing-associated H-X9-DG protein